MTWWRTVALVVQRELVSRRKASLIVTGVLVVVAVGMVVLVAAVNSGNGSPARLSPTEADELLGFLGVVIMFMAILMTGQVVLIGVAEEKSSRVAEVVLGAMRPRLLLLGKVLSIGLIGLFEVLLTGGLVLVVGGRLDTIELPAATGGAIAVVVFWFLLGFSFYSTVYAAAGSLLARHQNAANAAGSINVVMMVGYLIGVISSSSGSTGNLALKIASLTPPLAPTTMPLRMIRSEVGVWEISLSVILLVLASFGMILLAERVYSGGLLSSGKTRIREAFRNAVR